MRTSHLAPVLVLSLLAALPATAQNKRQERQEEKNLMRNVGIGLGAAAAHELVKGRTKNGVLLGAGAALAGKRYEDLRKAQNPSPRRWARRHPGKGHAYGLRRGHHKPHHD